MKYLLEVEHNNDCRKCPLSYYHDYSLAWNCSALSCYISSDYKPQSDCPLKPQPRCGNCIDCHEDEKPLCIHLSRFVTLDWYCADFKEKGE